MKRFLISVSIISFIFFSFFALAQGEGAVTDEMLKKYNKKVEANQMLDVKRNALTNVKITDLVKNWEIVNSYDFDFTHKLKTYSITNQHHTGRCWLFAALNILRRDVAKRYGMSNFELSQSYLFFYDKLEKSNTFLEMILDSKGKPITDRTLADYISGPVYDGGWWNMSTELIKKYGVVPKSVMRENVNTKSSRYMNRILTRMLLKFASELKPKVDEGADISVLRKDKEKMLGSIYQTLVMHLGEPPAKFTYRYEDKDKKLTDLKEYTPQSFLREFVKVNLDDYVVLMNDPRYEYGKLYSFAHSRNMSDKSDFMLINTDIETLKAATLKSILGDEPMWFAADSGRQLDRDAGVFAKGIFNYCAFFDVCMCMDKKNSIAYNLTNPSHAMVFTGVDIKDKKPVKWMVENSWGSKYGDKGYFVIYDSWFDEYVLAVVVKKQFVEKELLKVLDTEPVVLPPWDAMAQALSLE